MRGARGTHCSTPDVPATPKVALGAEFAYVMVFVVREPVELDEFIADNAETFTETDVASVRCLEVGQEIQYGGGAQPVSVLRRVE